METLIRCDTTVAVGMLGSSTEVEVLVGIFAAVAEELAWEPGNQLSAHLDRSRYFAAFVGETMAGGLQLILPDSRGVLPCHSVWPELALSNAERVAHVAILALCPAFRGRTGLFWPLCVELWRYCVEEKIDAVLLESTPAMVTLYKRLGFPLEVVGELRMHWGEGCYLTRLGIREVAGTLLIKAVRSDTYRALIHQAHRPIVPACCTLLPSLP